MSKKNIILTAIIVLNILISAFLIYRNYNNLAVPGLTPLAENLFSPQDSDLLFTPLDENVTKEFLDSPDYLRLESYGYEINYDVRTGNPDPFQPFREIIEGQ